MHRTAARDGRVAHSAGEPPAALMLTLRGPGPGERRGAIPPGMLRSQ